MFITRMKIITTENTSTGKEIIISVKKHMDRNNFEELMTIDDKGKNVVFKIKEKNKKVSELIMLLDENDQVVFMSITGDIDLKKISTLSKKMNISGLDALENIDNKE